MPPISSWVCFDGFHRGFHYYLSVSTNTVSNAARETHEHAVRSVWDDRQKREGPMGLQHICLFLSFCGDTPALKASSPSLRATLPTQHQLISYKNGKTAVFCISSPLCDGVIGLSVLLAAIFTVRQLHPAGCVVGVPSVEWELCLQHTSLPGGFYTL